MARPRSLIHGVGINDLDYNVSTRTPEGKQILCPFYATWRRMIRRCYSERDLLKHPTYVGKYVCDEWISASNFKAWMEKQYWEGLDLDKDILVADNTIYSPETCAFIPQKLNKILLYKREKGEFPIGVTLRSNPNNWNLAKMFISQVEKFNGGKSTRYFYTAKEAHKDWQEEKANQIEIAVGWYGNQSCFRTDVAEALTQRVWKLRLDSELGLETERL